MARCLILVLVFCGSAPAGTPDRFPHRVHVFEDFETDIEKRWWLRGTVETNNLPPSRSATLPNTRCLRAGPSKDFDRKMGDPDKDYKAVIFNPVPGPPMAGNTRLFFRYWLQGARELRVQLFSLSKGYHRQVVLKDLPQAKWESRVVDMTKARRPDGSGGPLAEDERIDDIQFYIDPAAELLIDDIVLYEPGRAGETRPFPADFKFTGWFDTGTQGKEWPGTFKIAPHEKPRTWDMAKSMRAADRRHTVHLSLRGMRRLSPGQRTRIFFRYRTDRTTQPSVVQFNSGLLLLGNSETKNVHALPWGADESGRWEAFDGAFRVPAGAVYGDSLTIKYDPVSFAVDDVLLYEPGE